MAIFHVEVHSRDRVIEHYIIPNIETQEDAVLYIRQYYADQGHQIGFWDQETDRFKYQYLIFQIKELEPKPVIYIAGEYRSQFPI